MKTYVALEGAFENQLLSHSVGGKRRCGGSGVDAVLRGKKTKSSRSLELNCNPNGRWGGGSEVQHPRNFAGLFFCGQKFRATPVVTEGSGSVKCSVRLSD